MKKLLALALTALMLVCAIAPAMAATHTTKDGETIESLVPNAELPDEFIEAGELFANDFLEDNPDPETGAPHGSRDDSHAYGAGISVLPGEKFAMTFEIDEAGTYEFCVAHYVRRDDLPAGYPHASSVQIDDGPLYSVNEDDADAVTLGAINYYTGMSAELTAGEHTFYFVGDYQNGINAYFSYVYYYMVGDEDAAEDDDPAEDTTAAPSAPAASGEASVAEALPELFADADVINLNVIYEEVNADGEYPAGEVLYGFHKSDFNKMGIPDMQGVMPFANCEYPVEFEVGDDGKYAFNVSLANYGTAGAVTVKFYDEDGSLIAEETITPVEMEVGTMYYYTLGTTLNLAADSWYTATFSGAQANGAAGNSIVCDFAYVLTELDEDAGSSADDTTAAPTTGGNTSPATFDVAVIALAVAGASAAVAVVSKKRR